MLILVVTLYVFEIVIFYLSSKRNEDRKKGKKNNYFHVKTLFRLVCSLERGSIKGWLTLCLSFINGPIGRCLLLMIIKNQIHPFLPNLYSKAPFLFVSGFSWHPITQWDLNKHNVSLCKA